MSEDPELKEEYIGKDIIYLNERRRLHKILVKGKCWAGFNTQL
jgi:hypothetical protein